MLLYRPKHLLRRPGAPRWRSAAEAAVSLVGTFVFGTVIGFAFLGCDESDALAPAAPLAPLPPEVRELRIEKPRSHWEKAGFFKLTPALPLPIPGKRDGKVEVFVKIPEGKRLTITEGPEGPLLVWPEGAEADRVESRLDLKTGTWAVADVRGGRVMAGGDEEQRLLRPTAPGYGGLPLSGFAWPRSQPAAEVAAHQHMAAKMRAGGGQLWQAKGKRLQKRIRTYLARGECTSCHAKRKPTAKTVETVLRPSDAQGWYIPMAVLTSSSPLERYRLRMIAADHPHIAVSCPDKKPPTRETSTHGKIRLTCRNKAPVTGVLDVRAGLAAADPHTQAVCASRDYLRRHLDEGGRAAFAAVFAECGLGSAGTPGETP